MVGVTSVAGFQIDSLITAACIAGDRYSLREPNRSAPEEFLTSLVHQVRDSYSSATAYFGWMREAKLFSPLLSWRAAVSRVEVGLPNCVEKKTPSNLETHRKLHFLCWKKIFLLLCGTSGSAGFFFVIRSPNNEYGKWDKTRLAVEIVMFVPSNSASAVINARSFLEQATN